MTAPMTSREELLNDPADLWDAYCAETPRSLRSPQGAMAFAFDKLVNAAAQGPRTPLDLSPNELNTLATDAFREAAQGAVNAAAHWKERHDTVLQKHIECCGAPAQVVRDAFKAGWYVNAGTDVEPAAEYLAECEQVDWEVYVSALPTPQQDRAGK